jgi:formylglycine-generating enzyme required for sulfatase activity
VQGLAQFDSPLIDPPDAQPPIIRRVEPFLMLDREVTRELYARFIAERPMWDRSNISQLQEAGLVDDRYLAWRQSEGSNPGDSPAAEPATEAAPMLPASHVSYHAAVAFAAWFQEQLPPEWSNWTVRLPSEAEWEWAARAVSTTMDEAVFRTGERAGPSPLSTARAPAAPVADLLGNLWEWTGSWYHPTAYAAARQLRADGSVVSTELFDQTPGAQRVVRGGSWANPPRSIGVVSRGAQPPEASTPFLGFRIVIVETADG